jgi:hypothetical protein
MAQNVITSLTQQRPNLLRHMIMIDDQGGLAATNSTASALLFGHGLSLF